MNSVKSKVECVKDPSTQISKIVPVTIPILDYPSFFYPLGHEIAMIIY